MKEKICCWVLVLLWLIGLAILCAAYSVWAAALGWLLSMLFAALLLIGEEEPALILEPLTLEEAENLDVCWLEIRSGFYVDPCTVGSVCGLSPNKRPVYGIGTAVEHAPLYLNSDYGVYWRCWADRPTDEDKKAAPWKEVTEA